MSAIDRSELDGYEALVSELRAHPPVAPEWLQQRVLELGPGVRGRRSRRRRLVLVVVPVAAALAVGAAVVHGFVSSGSPKFSANQTVFGAAERAVAHRPSATSHTKNQAPDTAAAPATTVATAGSALKQSLSPLRPAAKANESLVLPKNRLVHAAASLQVRVANRSALSQATNRATQIVASLGGYAQSVHYESSHHGDGDAVLALRVPVQKAEAAIAKLGNLGTILSQQLSTKDLQQQLTTQTNQIGSLRRSIAVYEQALKSGSLSAAERVEIEIKLSNARHAITELRKARTGTLASGATADIALTLTTHNSGAIGGGHHKTGRFGHLLGSAAGFLALEGIIVLYALVVLAPVLIVGGLGWWLLRERRRREESRLLASA
jgi:hypothetical protein